MRPIDGVPAPVDVSIMLSPTVLLFLFLDRVLLTVLPMWIPLTTKLRLFGGPRADPLAVLGSPCCISLTVGSSDCLLIFVCSFVCFFVCLSTSYSFGSCN